MLNWKQRLSVVSGNAFEFYDIAVFAAISPYITQIFKNSGIENAEYVVWGIFALRFLARPIGGYIIGMIADKKGKKNALVITSYLTGIATVLMGLLPTDINNIVIIFLLLQMIQAFSFGGEYPTIVNYLLDSSKSKEHSKTSSLIVASSIVGVIVSIVIVEVLTLLLSHQEMSEFGWRIPLFIGAINIGIGFWFRRTLPNHTTSKNKISGNNIEIITKTFLVAITGAIIFYVQNLSSGIIQNQLNIPHFSLINSLVLFVLILFSGWITDRYSHANEAFKRGLLSALFLYYPLYWLLSTADTLSVQLIALFLISFVSAIILSNLAAILFYIAKGQTLMLGLGYNIALSIFGGLSPLIVQILSNYDVSFVGLYAALSSIPALISYYIFAKVKKTIEFGI
ncbi:MFS transporter [Aliivibrio salmonicida]|uniref:MFS transporter n=1 Tax=Aliivibrio salmonicida TaxID=40269 RepID=UPI003D0963EE